MDEKIKRGGLPLTTIVFLIFLILKLCNIGEVATWSWWWVTSPLWIPFAIILFVFICYMIFVFIIAIVEIMFKKW